jgi:hypothetical protein
MKYRKSTIYLFSKYLIISVLINDLLTKNTNTSSQSLPLLYLRQRQIWYLL